MRQKMIRRLSVYLLVFLLLCTLASVQVQRMLLPQVTVAEPMPGKVVVEGVEAAYDYTIPFSALEWGGDGYYVYYVMEWEGRFGKEQSVMKMGVNVEAQDGVTAALDSKGYGEMVVQTNQPLEDGKRVMKAADSESFSE